MIALALTGAAIAGGVLGPRPWLGRFGALADTESGTVAVRLELWKVVAEVVRDRPVVGFGPDVLGSVIDRHYTPRLVTLENTPTFLIDRAHNAELDVLAASGLVGLASLAALAVVLLCAARRLYSAASEPIAVGSPHWLEAAAIAALAGHFVEQQFNLETASASALAWILAGVVVGHARLTVQVPRTLSPVKLRPSTWTRTAAVVATLLVAALLVGEGVSEGRLFAAETSYASALAWERSGNLQGATSALEATTNMWPADAAYWNELAKVRAANARADSTSASQPYSSAISAMETALDHDPARGLLWSNLGLVSGEAASRTNNLQVAQNARAAHERATQLAPGYWLYWRSRGATLLQLDEAANAADALKHATQLYDRDEPTWLALAQAAARAGNTGEARSAVEYALKLNGSDTQAQQLLAVLGR
jgi:tetratricopeptide (TPR) repeat protein